MLWSLSKTYEEEPFETEAELEAAINDASAAIFGSSRIYLDAKKIIAGWCLACIIAFWPTSYFSKEKQGQVYH